MAKVLVIPDVHLKPWMFDIADAVSTDKYDTIVCLGDLVDDWNKQFRQDLYEITLTRILAFDKEHPAMLWCYGNHDVSYRYCLQESGFSLHMMPTINKYLDQLVNQCGDRFAVIQKVDNWMFSHAGIDSEWVENHLSVTEPDDIRICTNRMIESRDDTQGHLWNSISPLWLRFQEPWGSEATRQRLYTGTNGNIKQCVGHSPTQKPYEVFREDLGLIALSADTFSTYSSGEPIGDEKLIIIDTDTSTWKYA